MSISKDEYRKLQLVQEIRQQRARLSHKPPEQPHCHHTEATFPHLRDSAAQTHTSAQMATTLPDHVESDAPFAQRLSTFVRLHPVFSGAVVALLSYQIGPTRLLRAGRYLLPLFSGLRISKHS